MTTKFGMLSCPVNGCRYVARERGLINLHKKVYEHVGQFHDPRNGFPASGKIVFSCPVSGCKFEATSFFRDTANERLWRHVAAKHK